jgi:hypothetical protein
VGAAVALLGLLSGAAARADTVSFPATGKEQTFTVPEGVTSLSVIIVGGNGGDAGPSPASGGGRGAQLIGTLAVTPGQVLYIEVGGNGNPANLRSSATGGFNGGGGETRTASTGEWGAGGGGATDVRTCSRSASTCDTLASRLLVAGGGAGAGGAGSGGTSPAPFGGWAGLFASGAGEDGSADPNTYYSGRGGMAGSLSAGGQGGRNGTISGGAGTGGSGTLGRGGDIGPPCSGSPMGGGGGGGLYGGGAGGNACVSASSGAFGGGGGAGSSGAPDAGVSNVTIGRSPANAGSVTIGYTLSPAITVSRSLLTFDGDQLLGIPAAPRSLTVTNLGLGTLNVLGTRLAGANPDEFSVVSDGGCQDPVPPQGSCQLAVGFTPAGIGARSAALGIASNDPVKRTTVVQLSGTGAQSIFGPVITRLTLTPASFRAAKSGPAIAPARPGTRVLYRLSEAASVHFTVWRALPGIRRGRVCARPPGGKPIARRSRCTRYVALKGSFDVTGGAGANQFTFTGRLNRRSLPPGSYRLEAVAGEGELRSRPAAAAFRVVAK